MNASQIVNINIKCLCASAIATVLCACGNGEMDPLTKATTETNENNFQAADFVANSDLRVSTLPSEDSPARDLVIPEGTAVSVLETKIDAEKGTVVRLGIETDENSGLPSDVWVVMDPSVISGLVRVEGDNLEATGEEGEPEPAAGDSLALGLGAVAVDAAARKRRMTYCYKYVKQYLLSTGQVKTYLPGESAYMAYNILPKHGFRKTGHTPATAQNGEVCVYSGGRQGHGHIEVKRNGRWWYGYGFLPNPMKNRKFLGCFAK